MMGRKFRERRKMHEYVFRQLINFTIGYERPIPQGNMWVYLSDKDKLLCHNIGIEDILPLAPQVVTAYVRIEGKRYLVISGYEGINTSIGENIYLKEAEIQAGSYLRLICELGLSVRRNSAKSKIYDELLFQHEEERYEGHDFNDLIPYFQSICLYELDEKDVVYDFALGKLIGVILTYNRELLPLNFSFELLKKYRDVFLSSIDTINYNALAKSLISVQWKETYLEIYRCIEAVFHSFAFKGIHSRSGSTINLNDFSIMLEDHLKFRPNEEETILTIFNHLDDTPINLLKSIKPVSAGDMKEGKWFYKVRNNIVHSRPANEEINFENQIWDTMILASLHVLEQTHQTYIASNSKAV